MKQFKAFFAAVVMMMTSQVVMAQTTVKGMLMDETLNESEPFATIRVFKAGKTEKPSPCSSPTRTASSLTR